MDKLSPYSRAARRTQRFCFALALLALPSLPAAAAPAVPTPATILVGGKPLTFVVEPFVNEKGEVVGPVDFVRALGGSYVPHAENQTVTVTGLGKTFTIPYALNQQRCFVPVQAVTTMLGAVADWRPEKRTLSIKARLVQVRNDAGTLSVTTSFPVRYEVSRIENPARVFVDLHGLDLASKPATIPAEGGNITRIRTGQINPDTVRVTVDLRKDMPFKVASALPDDHVAVTFPDNGAAPIVPIRPVVTIPQRVINLSSALPSRTLNVDRNNPTGRAPIVQEQQPAVTVPDPPAPAVRQSDPQPAAGIALPRTAAPKIVSVNFRKATDTVVQVEIKTTGPARYRTETLANPDRLAFDLEGADLDEALTRGFLTGDSVVKGVRAGILRTGQARYGRIVLDLSRQVPAIVNASPGESGMTYVVSLDLGSPDQPQPSETPEAPSGETPAPGDTPAPEAPPSVTPQHPTANLAGKVVVVDPGHGADDTGAIGIGGVFEKDMNLAIGKKLRDSLEAAGATVYMTRDSDIKPSLAERPRIAAAYGADYFISVHCDESGGRNSHSGSTVYYHASNQVCRRLARAISGRLGQGTGIPAIGIRSDTVRFRTGFAVLRGSQMPAVLVECGYMNSDSDLSHLTDSDAQQRIADSIVDGLRDYAAAKH